MVVFQAVEADFDSWLALAAEVEHLFGPMVNEPTFLNSLRRGIGRGTAYCVRAGDGAPGSPLVGGVLFSPHPPLYKIGWLAVSARARRLGVGRLLMEHVQSLVVPPCTLEVVTFGPGIRDGRPARRFYQSFGFVACEPGPDTPHGLSTQVFRKRIEA